MQYLNVPNNPMMLLSFINTKLRDEEMTLSQLCYDLEIDEEEINTKLNMIDYYYDKKLNRFL